MLMATTVSPRSVSAAGTAAYTALAILMCDILQMAAADDPYGALVTGISANHLHQVRGMLQTAKTHLPTSWRFIVYDLVGDMKPVDVSRVQKWCRVDYRRFDTVSAATKSHRNLSTPTSNLHARNVVRSMLDPRFLTNSAWKPLIILECLASLPEDSILVYADASMRFTGSLAESGLLQLASRYSFVGKTTASPIAMYTHPKTFTELARISRNRTRPEIREYMHARMVCGCVSLWKNTRFARLRIMQPWVQCAKQRSCIQPAGADGFKVNNNSVESMPVGFDTECRPGLDGHCHRGDQSVLSTILFELFGRKTFETLSRHGARGAEESSGKAAEEGKGRGPGLAPCSQDTPDSVCLAAEYAPPQMAKWAWTRRGAKGTAAGPCYDLPM